MVRVADVDLVRRASELAGDLEAVPRLGNARIELEPGDSVRRSGLTNLCERAVWIDNGSVAMDGPATEVVAAFTARSAGVQPGAGELEAGRSRISA